MGYPFREIETRWQSRWDEQQTFKTNPDPPQKEKLYVLDMFPYPSGAGLHVGHPEGYTATDILCRYKRMCGMEVLHPIGWDAFGLPAERYAMQTNIHPSMTTTQNINNFRRQIKMLGLSYDWSREINTTDPSYYKWTQWIFLQVYHAWYDPRARAARPIGRLEQELSEHGTANIPGATPLSASEWESMSRKEKHDFLAGYRLAYVDEIAVNWCEALGTVLANEEVDEWMEKGYSVERRPMRQWMMRITAYADRLLEDAEGLDWPVSTLEQQRNWIGRSEGAWIDFPLHHGDQALRVFTTRADTIFGATFLVIAPEHHRVPHLTTPENRKMVEAYVSRTRLRSDLERGIGEKTGVFSGAYAINPATGKSIPVWVADYVLMGYGAGAIMGVPGHDVRDHAFARNNGLPIVRVISGNGTNPDPYEGEGICINSSNNEISLEGMNSEEARSGIVAWLGGKGLGRAATQYKLRDWLFSRQRYWGEPIPIVHLEDGTMMALDESRLPLLLPELKKFQPSGTTESPLALAEDWLSVTDPATGLRGKRETNTMPQWAGSCWYYLRFLDPENNGRFCSPDRERRWMPVDLYVGGSEHAVLHLMYARFWHKILFDLGFVSTAEPFRKLRHQGIILGEDNRKMSKGLGNVVNPDDVVGQYGADALRLFEMFMGPLEDMKPWSTNGVEGVSRFLNRVWRLFIDEDGRISTAVQPVGVPSDLEFVFHTTVKKVTEDIENLRFNTAISQMMIFVNEAMKVPIRPLAVLEPFILLLSPFAPHIAEEIWSRLGKTASLAHAPWPQFDPSKLGRSMVELVLQVNGKIRSRMQVPVDTPSGELEELCLADEVMQRYLDGKKPIRVIAVPNKLVNVVIG